MPPESKTPLTDAALMNRLRMTGVDCLWWVQADFARSLEVRLAEAEGQLKKQSELPMPSDWNNPFYVETMKQAETLKFIALQSNNESAMPLNDAARKLEYMAQSFTCTANFVPMLLERDYLKQQLAEANELAAGLDGNRIAAEEEIKRLEKQLDEAMECVKELAEGCKNGMHTKHDAGSNYEACPVCQALTRAQKLISENDGAMPRAVNNQKI